MPHKSGYPKRGQRAMTNKYKNSKKSGGGQSFNGSDSTKVVPNPAYTAWKKSRNESFT